MPVYKFKSFEDAERALWNFNPDSDYYRRVAGLFQITFKLSPPACKRGVHPYRNIEEAARDR